MGLSFRMVFNGTMALSVGTLAGWLYSAKPADVSAVSAKLMNLVGPIITPRAKEPAATVANKAQPASAPLVPTVAAPSAKAASPAPVAESDKRFVKPVRKPAKKAASAAKRGKPEPAIVQPRNPKSAQAPKKRRPVSDDD